MSGVLAVLAASGRVKPITTSGNWGSNSVSSPSQAVSVAITLTVPAGNPGVITLTASGATTSYSKNGGSAVNFTSGDVTFANGDTLSFRYNNPSGGVTIVTVVDKTTNTTLGGGWTGSVV